VDRQARADAIVRATLSLADADLRTHYVATLARTWPIDELAEVLDAVCERAEQAEATSREALIAIVDALNGEGMDDLVQRLREQAAGNFLLALERLIRLPPRSHRPTSSAPPREAPEREGRGRSVPLGARKSLARRADRDTLLRMLLDPHPDVIRRCLANPLLVEDDVVRLGARRPGRPEVLGEIARSPWVQRPRVRMTLPPRSTSSCDSPGCCSGPSSRWPLARPPSPLRCVRSVSSTSSAVRPSASPSPRSRISSRPRARAPRRMRRRGTDRPPSAFFFLDLPPRERGHPDGGSARRAERHALESSLLAARPEVDAPARNAVAVGFVGRGDRLAARVAPRRRDLDEERLVGSNGQLFGRGRGFLRARWIRSLRRRLGGSRGRIRRKVSHLSRARR
jgi:hypothetical protein